MNWNLKNKTALITGAAGLLGVEHTIALASCGAKVIMTDINLSALRNNAKAIIEEYGEELIHCIEMDVTNEESVMSVSSALEQTGGIDILINNAAIDPKVDANNNVKEMSRLENFPLSQWDFQLNVGLTGAFICSKIFGHSMAINKSEGVILNIASDLSVFAPDQRLYKKNGLADDQQPVKPVTYSVIKAGLIGLTRYLATYWADQGVRCNALSPGGVYNGQNEEFVQRLTHLIPQGRMAEKNEYHGAIQFLCSDASRYLNGQNIVMDGGRSVL